MDTEALLPEQRSPATVDTPFSSRFPTGTKLFLIISAALLPLAVVAIIATVQTNRVADAEARARLRIAASEIAHSIAIELIGDMTALRSAVGSLSSGNADGPGCARIQGVFAAQMAAGARFMIVDRAGNLLCGTRFNSPPHPRSNQPITASMAGDAGLILSIAPTRRGPSAKAYFPRSFLARIATPASKALPISSAIIDEEEALTLTTIPDVAAFDRLETIDTNLNVGDLSLRTSVRSAPITSSFVVSLLLPLMMWAAAAGISWFVVDRLLIRPLRQLRRTVANYRPGEEIEADVGSSAAAYEIRDLGDTFRAISQTVARHEAGLAVGLVRQTKLTREVHHRVKNNLQVISSLINFHARATSSKDAIEAYATIQRRVDTLAVVHRNHFAELEESHGLSLRAVIAELASTLRASLADGSMGGPIALDVDPLFVNQDVAMPVAFLITESVDLAMRRSCAASVRIAVKPAAAAGRATLCIASPALIARDGDEALTSDRYGRILQGLSRQLRAPLDHDAEFGALRIEIPVLGFDGR